MSIHLFVPQSPICEQWGGSFLKAWSPSTEPEHPVGASVLRTRPKACENELRILPPALTMQPRSAPTDPKLALPLLPRSALNTGLGCPLPSFRFISGPCPTPSQPTPWSTLRTCSDGCLWLCPHLVSLKHAPPGSAPLSDFCLDLSPLLTPPEWGSGEFQSGRQGHAYGSTNLRRVWHADDAP